MKIEFDRVRLNKYVLTSLVLAQVAAGRFVYEFEFNDTRG